MHGLQPGFLLEQQLVQQHKTLPCAVLGGMWDGRSCPCGQGAWKVQLKSRLFGTRTAKCLIQGPYINGNCVAATLQNAAVFVACGNPGSALVLPGVAGWRLHPCTPCFCLQNKTTCKLLLQATVSKAGFLPALCSICVQPHGRTEVSASAKCYCRPWCVQCWQ